MSRLGKVWLNLQLIFCPRLSKNPINFFHSNHFRIELKIDLNQMNLLKCNEQHINLCFFPLA